MPEGMLSYLPSTAAVVMTKLLLEPSTRTATASNFWSKNAIFPMMKTNLVSMSKENLADSGTKLTPNSFSVSNIQTQLRKMRPMKVHSLYCRIIEFDP